MPQLFDDVGECVEATLQRVGKRVVMALPLALGKPVPLVNEFYRRALREPAIELKIFTALSLRTPTASSELERRFLEPFVSRVFGNYPQLQYIDAVRAGSLPANVEVNEFYLEPGAWLASPCAQQHYVSTNYTHVVRAVLARGANVLPQLVARRQYQGRQQFSLSCNSDLTVDLLAAAQVHGQKILAIGAVNRQLPFMFGAAVREEDTFDFVLDHPRYDFDLYCPPNMSIGTVDYLIGLHASALVRDGGTLQLGIGELGDAVTYCLQLRHRQNETYRRVLRDCGIEARFGAAVATIGGADTFHEGLYGCTEMFVDGFLDLYRSGILKRRVQPDDCVLHGGFFLGPKGFYAALRNLPEAERRLFQMTGVDYINQLYGPDMARRVEQRRDARFINTAMMSTLLGAAVSDTLADGAVVSGVGGQYNFTAMAHALPGGRSMLAVRSTRRSKGRLSSNIVWEYGQTTIPRHLRDIVITEYGIADLCDKSDSEVIAALLDITDSRFQDGLLRQAQAAGKISRRHRIADAHRQNTPAALERALAPHRRAGLFTEYPFGTDFTAEEIVLAKALKRLQARTGTTPAKMWTGMHALLRRGLPAHLHPYVQRMQLDRPRTAGEWLLQRVLVDALLAVSRNDAG
jgi:acyl-CoA hydrolase